MGFAATLLLAPVLGAVMYACLQWGLLKQRTRQRVARGAHGSNYNASNRFDQVHSQPPNGSPASRSSTEDVVLSCSVEYACHVAALSLLSWSVWLVILETFDRLAVTARSSLGSSPTGTECALWFAGITTTAVVGTAVGIAVVRLLESPRLGSFINLVRRRVLAAPSSAVHQDALNVPLPSSFVLSLVMFVHAAMEGFVLGLLFGRESFADIFWSVALHNVPEGLVVAVATFGMERGEEVHADADMRNVPCTPTTPALLMHAGQSGGGALQRWRRCAIESASAAFWSHAGQAFAFACVAYTTMPSGSMDRSTPTLVDDEEAMTVISHTELLLIAISTGSMVATILFELLPDVAHPPSAITDRFRSSAGTSSKKQR